MFDIAVVGAGPIGLYTAKLCEDAGYKVVIFEEHKEIGKPLACSGLISSNIRNFFPDIDDWGVIENKVNGAKIYSKNSKIILKKSNAALVIDRVKFDKKISENVKSEIRYGHRVIDVEVTEKNVFVKTDKGSETCKMLIGCDGPFSMVAKSFTGKGEMVKGLIAITSEKNSGENVEMYFDKSFIKDGFFWKIPRGQKTEYGVFGKNASFSNIDDFFKIGKNVKFAGMIPVSPVKRTYSKRILLIGDSAGQVKPWSGGGIIYGLTCADIAIKIIEKAFNSNDFSEKILKEYEKLWKAKIGKQIIAGRVFRKMLEISNNLQIDIALRAGKLFNQKKMDMDFILSGP